MAQIIFNHTDSTQGVKLSDPDKSLLMEAIENKKRVGTTVTQIASDLGVSRTYFYNLIDLPIIELKRFMQLQDYFQLRLLTEAEVETYLTFLRQQLLLLDCPAKMHSFLSPSPGWQGVGYGVKDLVATVQKPLNLSSWRDY